MDIKSRDLSPALLARCCNAQPVKSKPVKSKPVSGLPHSRMNKGEAAYAEHLRIRVASGEVVSFAFEAVRLKLADRCTILPDFFVRMKDGSIEFHEVKGRKGETFYCKEDAMIKLKVAARLYPFWTFRIVWPAPGAGWRQREVVP
jgi:hypothetical protein